jgi:multimeric flavodoxin WrbA
MVKQAKTNLGEDAEFEEVQLMKEKIPMCNGCFKCILEGEENCPHQEIISPIIEKILWADGIIITSPVYAMNVTALLKNLFDHTAYLYHRPRFFTKKALIVVTSAGAGQKDVAKYIDETLRHWGFNKTYIIAQAIGDGNFNESKINKTSEQFFKDVTTKKLHSPKLNDIIFFDVWKAMAKSQNSIEKDKEYWNETELINYDFAPEIKLGIFKKIFSKLTFFMMQMVIK